MIVAVASGKGGTGKTTVAVSLALSLAAGTTSDEPAAPPLPYSEGSSPLFLDCDVEEPNAALFLRPVIEEQREVGLLVPEIDLGLCTYCGRCAEVCEYHAIAVLEKQVLVFSEMCHGCGSCALNCPETAIREVLHPMGTIERGRPGEIAFAQGTMNVGQAMATPIIRQLKHWAISPRAAAAQSRAPAERPIILDAPPGAACPVVETMRGANVVLMVTEPTPFGLHDLRVAVKVARDELGLPVSVVVNRDGVGDQGVDEYCASEGIPVLMRIPLDRRIAEAYSEGIPLVDALPACRERFAHLWEQLVALGSSSVHVGVDR
ncbi:MAG: ATP-binding protein [Ardenticatenia bacterium]|nr:ATP-binding protein [Ardenticatenia bacterium]